MANLPKLKQFAADHDFGLTAPLTHAQVTLLAEHWFPDMRFYEEEKFHPISLDEMFSRVDDLFGSLPEPAQKEWLVSKFLRQDSGLGVTQTFAPPLVTVPDGVALDPQLAGQANSLPRLAVRVISQGSSARAGLEDADVGGDAVVTHGASFKRSNQFFGAKETVAGGAEAAPGDPFLPRATGGDGRPLITVMASLVNLFELLKYELLVSESRDDDNPEKRYPPDGLRGAFDVTSSLVQPITQQSLPLTPAAIRKFLLEMIAFQEGGGAQPTPPPGWRLNRTAWNVVTRFAFLQYDFFYAFNDFNRYQDALFANEHEGDDEGCCLVFDRTNFNIAPNDTTALLRTIPHSMITAVHDEDQEADNFKFVDPPLTFPPDARARDLVPFTVYIAAGSHATYLTGGTHDLVDFQDYVAKVQENPIVLLLVPGIVVAVLIILAIIEHFTDTEDITSEDGIRTGPEAVVGSAPPVVSNRLVVMPMSADNHIYKDNDDLLRLRAYAGLWGAHDGLIDHSPQFKAKTGRYFRKLLSEI